ncbi:MAG: tRNA pseudouridine(55) synthase TruB [Planctomycetaceae bacterium]
MSVQDFKSICGVLNVHKPAGVSSRQVVTDVEWNLRRLAREAGQKLRRGTVKVGHAGTLDPLATGVLVICIGKATQLVPYLQDRPKTYLAEFTLGVRSETDDTEGELIPVPDAIPPASNHIEEALSNYQGEIDQVPPSFSAVHVDGVRAYALARRGKEVSIDARPVEVHEIKLLDYQWPEISLEIQCGSGTYIRSIARDLGNDLGCGAVMHGLTRSVIGQFTHEKAITIPQIRESNWLSFLHSPLVAVDHLPCYSCTESEQDCLIHGRTITPESNDSLREMLEELDELPVVNKQNELVCLARIKKAGEEPMLQPRLVFIKTSR